MTVQLDITERPILLLGWDTNRTVYPSGIASGEAFGTAQANAVVEATGIESVAAVGTASSVASVEATAITGATTAGTPAAVFLLAPEGIASGAALGTTKTTARIAPTQGIQTSIAFGTVNAFTSMNPSGTDAAGDGPGEPSLTMVMSPEAIAGTEAFGDADTLATVFIIPGPVDPSNDFGDAVVTRKGWIFRPPRNTYQWRIPPYKEYEGISLLKESGSWVEVAHPDLERTLSADVYLGGGRDHVVSTTLKGELEDLGYTVTEEVVTTEVFL